VLHRYSSARAVALGRRFVAAINQHAGKLNSEMSNALAFQARD
jgi:hypothetical protein